MITRPLWYLVLGLCSVCPARKPSCRRYSSATLSVSPASRGMALLPPCEAEVAAELCGDVTLLSGDVALPVAAEPDVAGDVLVVDANPPQALRAPTASAVSSRILVVLELCPGMISPTASLRTAVRLPSRCPVVPGLARRPGQDPVTDRGFVPGLMPIDGIEQSRDK